MDLRVLVNGDLFKCYFFKVVSLKVGRHYRRNSRSWFLDQGTNHRLAQLLHKFEHHPDLVGQEDLVWDIVVLGQELLEERKESSR